MPSPSLQILLVEDDEIDTAQLLRCLHRHHRELAVTAVATATEAFHALRGHAGQPPLPQPYVILLDLKLPGLSGLEFLNTLRQDPHLKRTIVFVVTDSSRASDKSAAYELGVAGYFLKSELDEGYTRLLHLLEAYQQVVEFPSFTTPTPSAILVR